MSARIRGQEAFIKFSVGGIGLLEGSFAKVKDFTYTPRTDLVETDYLGETFTDLDIQHHGFDFSFTVDEMDRTSLDYLAQVLDNEEVHEAPAEVVMQVNIVYREAGVAASQLIFSNIVMKVNEMGFSARNEYVSTSYEGKAKRVKIK